MQRMILTALMWPLGIGGFLGLAATGQAAESWGGRAETLNYVVSVGPFTLGAATLDYQPGVPKGGEITYVLSAAVRGGVPFFKVDDGWTALGKSTSLAGAKGVLMSESFHIVQHENNYRSDKIVGFDRTRGAVTYQNQLDEKDRHDVQLLKPAELRDPLSALYALRALGPSVLAGPHELTVMGIKLPFAVHVAAGVPEKLRWHGEKIATQRVVMTMDDPKHPGKSDSWTIWVKPEDGLLPVKIAAKMGIGSFAAILQ